MPTERPKRRRQRRKSGFTAAQIQYLTGELQAGANKFELLHLDYASRPTELAALSTLLDRAGVVVSNERIAALRADLEARLLKTTA